MTLQIGEKAPDFSLPDQEGNIVRLSDCRGKKIVLYFYPKDNTPGCTKESCDFRDHFSAFKKKNTLVFGISKDSAKSHNRFKDKYELPFPLLVDEDGEVAASYGVIDKKSLFGNTFLGVTRSTFLIDEDGILQGIWRKVKVSGHVEQVLDELN